MFGRPGAAITDVPTMVESTASITFVQVLVNDHSINALDSDGHIWAWGQRGSWLGMV